MGAIRSWEEIQLVKGGVFIFAVPRKKLLMAGRYHDGSGRWLRKWRQTRWQFWLWRQGAATEEGFIPDNELYRFLDTADVVIVPHG